MKPKYIFNNKNNSNDGEEHNLFILSHLIYVLEKNRVITIKFKSDMTGRKDKYQNYGQVLRKEPKVITSN